MKNQRTITILLLLTLSCCASNGNSTPNPGDLLFSGMMIVPNASCDDIVFQGDNIEIPDWIGDGDPLVRAGTLVIMWASIVADSYQGDTEMWVTTTIVRCRLKPAVEHMRQIADNTELL